MSQTCMDGNEPMQNPWQELSPYFFPLTILRSFIPVAPVETGITGQARALPRVSFFLVSFFFFFFSDN